MLAPSNNDPMSPITEEAAPEFPSKFEESGESETLGRALQAENTTAVEGNPGEGSLQDDCHVTHDEMSLPPRDEVASLDEATDNERTDNFNGSLPEKESEVSELKMIEMVEAASGENSSLSIVDSAVSSGNCEVISSAHSTRDPSLEVTCMTNGDVHDSDEVTTESAQSEKCSHTQKDKLKYPDDSTKTNTLKEGTFIPQLQSSTICAEQSSFAGPSARNTNLLMAENGLEVAYDRNSVNNGGGMVKMQFEKCPA